MDISGLSNIYTDYMNQQADNVSSKKMQDTVSKDYSQATDEELLEKTGGIVQGMSGASIVQNGRIVGAVTHVLVRDSSRGYGIFIEDMLNVAG